MWTERIEPRLDVPEVLVLTSRAAPEGKSAGTTDRMSEVRSQDCCQRECLPALRRRLPKTDVQPSLCCGTSCRNLDPIRNIQIVPE